ncbi:MAG: hypothetical protein ACMXYA_02315 [Candidatus Woesearchaeota archaeon]
MELKILSETQNKSMQRKIIEAEVHFLEKATPSRAEIQETIAKKQKADKELVVIASLDAKFGANSTKITAYVYNSQKALAQFEPKYVVEKHKVAPAEEEKAEA